MARAFIGVGANLHPLANIRAAIRLLSLRTRVVAVSTFYRSPAEGRPEQPDYINGVVLVETDLPPESLKNEALRIEHSLGRRRTDDKYAARTIDLDLLLYDSLLSDLPDLRLPSPDIESRAFVAVPLAEIAPEVVLPGSNISVKEVAERFARNSLEPLRDLTEELRKECARC